MGKIRRGNYIFLTWVGDHDPKHVHIFKNGTWIAKWDLEADKLMESKVSARVRKLIDQLKEEDRL